MEISEKIVKFKIPILFLAAFSLIIFSVVYVAPKFLDILKYFWPLLLSTALFLATVAAFSRITPPVPEESGEGILDYVAGQHEHEDLLPPVLLAESVEEEEEGNKE
nr:uncharacterized protein LOC113689905 [Ipomoea batatas]